MKMNSRERKFFTDNSCHPDCCYRWDCGGFRNREGRCPEWTKDAPFAPIEMKVDKTESGWKVKIS